MRILPGVAAKWGENPHGLRGTVFPAIFVSRELAGPNPARNSAQGKGKRVNIPAPPRYMRQRKPARGRLGLGQRKSSAETRGEPSWREPGEGVMSLLMEVWLMPRAHENASRKDPRRPYQEPTQVPLAEKAKACRVMSP